MTDPIRSASSQESTDGTSVVRSPGTPCVLHVIPSFAIGGVPIRAATLIDHFGARFRHRILALDGRYDCLRRITDSSVEVVDAGVAEGRSILSRLFRIVRSLHRIKPDLLVTYNWGAIEWTLGGKLAGLCPQIHIEDGFGIEEAKRTFRRRNLFRRLVLPRVARVVVPSHSLHDIARQTWRVPHSRLIRIPNGVDCERFSVPAREPCSPMLGSISGRLVIGTIAPLRAEKNLGFLLETFARLDPAVPVALLIVGDGPEHSSLMKRAERLGISNRTIFAGQTDRVGDCLAVMDLFALTSETEQMPFSILQAMAAGKAVISLDVGDVRRMLSSENQPYIVARSDPSLFQDKLTRLLMDDAARSRIGQANQARARREFGEDRMFALYDGLVTEILGERFGVVDVSRRVEGEP